METQLKNLVEFHEVFGSYMQAQPNPAIPPEVSRMRIRLLQEELDEYQEAVEKGDLLGIADALTDLLYVLFGTMVSHGLQDFAAALFEEVHRSNMSKLDENGRPIFREDGKVLKSNQFSPPDLRRILPQGKDRSGTDYADFIPPAGN